MSRRHHGGRPHRANGPGRPVDTSRPIAPAAPPQPVPATTPPVADERLQPASDTTLATNGAAPLPVQAVPLPPPPDREGGEPLSRMDGASGPMANGNGTLAASPTPDRNPAVNGGRLPGGPQLGNGSACTAPQLRRFIKSRPYVPMHELRRRFGIDGGEDDVTPVDLANGRIFVGLPQREGSLLGELLRGGEVGFELSMDPRSPVVIGLYPMRPVART